MTTSMRILCKFTILALLLSSALLRADDKLSVRLADEGANSAEKVTPEVQKELLAAVEVWKQAVISKDRARLAQVFHDDLSYGHTTGEVQTKAQTIDRILNNKATYEAIDVSDVNIRVYGKLALLTGKFAFHINKDGARTVSNLSGIDVWIAGPQGWQLLARQLTRPPE
jgi:hypothetical protein